MQVIRIYILLFSSVFLLQIILQTGIHVQLYDIIREGTKFDHILYDISRIWHSALWPGF